MSDRPSSGRRQEAHRVMPRSVVLTIDELRTLLDDALHLSGHAPFHT